MSMDDKSYEDLVAMFAGYALSGYVREGLSYASRKEECEEVAIGCYDLAFALTDEHIARFKKIEQQEAQDS